MVALAASGGAAACAATADLPEVWALHDSKAGMRSQVLGLAEATGLPFVEKALRVRRPWAWLPPQVWLAPLAAVADQGWPLRPPWPRLVIGCGRNTAAPALAIRRAAGGRTLAVQIQDPRIGRDAFDLMVVPAHDRLRGKRVVVTAGAVHRVTPERLAEALRGFPALTALPRPVVGVLLGGANRAYRFDPTRLGAIAAAIAAAVRRCGGSVVATPSRRTGAAGLAALREHLGSLPGEIWDGAGTNPYYAYLAIADALLVTADSVSMISEAAATGKPVHVIALPGGDRKFARFHERMQRAGVTRPFVGDIEAWSYAPLDDTARAGAAVRELLLAHLARGPRV